MLFGYEHRCIENDNGSCPATQSGWPDVPMDQICTSGESCTGRTSPTFFSRKRLASVTTQVRKSGEFQNVDVWTLTHTYPAPGDGTSAALWLARIGHAGKAGGSVDLPNVTFGGTQLTNRVDAVEGIAPLVKWRVRHVTSETGGRLLVNYASTNCSRSDLPSPASNTKRCFPSYWTPDGANEPRLDWFHKYVVSNVTQLDMTGASGDPTSTQLKTQYHYYGGGAWRYDDVLTPAKYRTWSEWRGYQQVTTTVGTVEFGTRSQTSALYMRGMHGDRNGSGGTKTVRVTDSEGGELVDYDHLAGFVRETRVFNGVGGAEVSGAINEPWSRQTAAGGGLTAHLVNTGRVETRTALDEGRGMRRGTVINSYTDDGLIASINDQGNAAASGDERCTRTTYAQNRGDWMLAYPSRVETVAVGCGTTPSRPGDVVSDVRTGYDGQAVGAAPTKGNPTTEQRVASYEGGAPVYQTVATTGYDAHGRATSVTDADGNTTTTAFTPATGGPVTKTTETNPLGHTQTTQLDPAWGLPTRQTDANGRITELHYDPLGRLTKVWLPNRTSQSHPDNPNLKFSYRISKTSATAVSSSRLNQSRSGYVTTWEIYDGWLRPRQTQAPAPDGGRIITETIYNHRGLVEHERTDLYNSSDPGPGLVTAGVDTFPASTTYTYDGADRVTAEIFSVEGKEEWRTTRAYGGDRVYTDPPAGAPGTTQISDIRGNVVERRLHPGGSASGSFTATSYDYDAADRLVGITDNEGNQWSYTFDLRGRQVSSSDPDAGVTTQTFDGLDRLATSTDARRRTLAYTWDELGRKTGQYQGSTSGTKLAEWTYDTVANSLGMLADSTRFVDGHAYVRRVEEYDQWYRPLQTAWVIPEVEGALAGTYPQNYDYDLSGTVAYETQPTIEGLFPTEIVDFSYNELGMPVRTQGLATYVDDTVYSKQGDPLQYTMGHRSGSKVVQLNRYYENGTRRLWRQSTSDSTNTVAATDRRYSYNPAGDITQTTEVAGPDEVECFVRDGYRRLTQAWTQAGTACAAQPSTDVVGGVSPYWMSYSYTATGLRESRTAHAVGGTGEQEVATYTYPTPGQVRPHAVDTISTTTGTGEGAVTAVRGFSYDAAGNTTGRTNHLTGVAQSVGWDDEGRLASISEGGEVVEENLYDAEGNLLIRRTPEETVLFLGDTEAHLSADGVLSGVRYYAHNGETIAVRTTNPDEGMKLSWLIPDHQGTSQIEITSFEQTILERRQSPFGVLREDPVGWRSSRSFVGGYGDSQSGSGLVHLGARDYDPVTGRFLSVDPVLDPADPQSLTGYGYAANNPVTHSDPSGLYWKWVDSNGGPGEVDKKNFQRVQKEYRAWKTQHARMEKAVKSAKRFNNKIRDYRQKHGFVPPPMVAKPKPGVTGKLGSFVGRAFGVLGMLLMLCGDTPDAAGCEGDQSSSSDRRERYGSVSLDNNVLVGAKDEGRLEQVDAAINKREPVVSPQAWHEFTRGAQGNSRQQWLKKFLAERGGRIGLPARADADSHWNAVLQTRYPGRVLSKGDPFILDSAHKERIPILTYDKRFAKRLVDIGHPVELLQ